MKDAVILYEHKVREMESVLLIKYEMMRRGYSVDIHSRYEFDRIKYLFKKYRMVITPFLYSKYELDTYILNVFGKYKRILNLQWEQVYTGSGAKSKSTPKGPAADAVHICWGNNSYTRLKNGGCKKSVITGAIQMDLLKPAFRSWYMDRSTLFKKYGLDPDKRTLLFISSFSCIGRTDEYLNMFKDLADYDMLEMRALEEKTRDEVLEWFDSFLQEHPDVNIIYRPHPAEHPADDKVGQLCRKHSNMHCIQSESVKQWIVTCDTVLNWQSTSGVEAYFAGRSCLFLIPYEVPESMSYVMYRDCCKAHTYDEFSAYVSDPGRIDAYYRAHPMDKAISEYYDTSEGFAYKRICDVIEKMLHTDKYDMEKVDFSLFTHIEKSVKEAVRLIACWAYEKNIPLSHAIVDHSEKLTYAVQHHRVEKGEIITKQEEKAVARKIKRIIGK